MEHATMISVYPPPESITKTFAQEAHHPPYSRMAGESGGLAPLEHFRPKGLVDI